MEHSMAEVRTGVREIVERMLADYDSAHAALGQQLFREAYPELLDDLGAQLADGRIRTLVGDELRLNGRNGGGSDQLTLDGVGDIDRTITISDGEGGCRYKLTVKATEDELVQDHELLRTNTAAMIASTQRAKLRNAALIPVMQEHGFKTAGEAIRFIQAVA